jgi:hypothetical protein
MAERRTGIGHLVAALAIAAAGGVFGGSSAAFAGEKVALSPNDLDTLEARLLLCEAADRLREGRLSEDALARLSEAGIEIEDLAELVSSLAELESADEMAIALETELCAKGGPDWGFLGDLESWEETASGAVPTPAPTGARTRWGWRGPVEGDGAVTLSPTPTPDGAFTRWGWRGPVEWDGAVMLSPTPEPAGGRSRWGWRGPVEGDGAVTLALTPEPAGARHRWGWRGPVEWDGAVTLSPTPEPAGGRSRWGWRGLTRWYERTFGRDALPTYTVSFAPRPDGSVLCRVSARAR